MFWIEIKGVNSKSIFTFVENQTTIHTLKQQIQNEKGVPSKYIRLIYANKQLEDHKNIEDYQIQKSANVFMTYQAATKRCKILI